MSHRVLAVMLASLALISGGCGSGEPDSPEEETVAPETTQGEASPVPTQPLSTQPDEPATAPKKAPSPSAGLIGSTDPDERAQQIQSRINAERNGETQVASNEDPFSLLSVPPARVKLPATVAADGTGVTIPGGTTVAAGGTAVTTPGGTTVTADGTTVTTPGGGAGTTGGGAGTTGGGAGTPGGGAGSPEIASLPPLPPVTAQVASPVSDIPTLFVPSTIPLSSESTIAVSPTGGGGGGSTPSPSSTGGGGGSTSSPSSTGGGGGGSTPSPSVESQPIASLPPLPPLPPAIGPALPPDEPVAALPPLDGEPITQLPPLPVAIGPAIPPAPVEPPAVAETITITGVVQVGNEIQVIVQLPGNSSGRYVKVGDLIANGTVRIKRVEGIQGNNPIVILEEEGVEYARAVGDVPMIAMEEPDRG
ncbi:MAG: hypothetical protein WBG66_16375 [Geitlerinemataceae cyanobacterium]